MKRNLIFVSYLLEIMYKVTFEIDEVFISSRDVHIFYNRLENNLYVLKSTEAKAILSIEMFKTAETQNKSKIFF